VAYQCGKAAKVAPPAVSTHTSLPSQTGPDAVEEDAAALLGVVGVAALPEDGEEHADTEVEALQDEVAGPQHGDEEEPDHCEVHV
jgi:hypothetical protein